MKSNKGFTLIELLIVLAIIGVLAVVGIETIQDNNSDHVPFEDESTVTVTTLADKSTIEIIDHLQIKDNIPESELPRKWRNPSSIDHYLGKQ